MSKLIFFFFNQNICCGCSKELSHGDGSCEHPKQMLKLMGKKIFTFLCSKCLFILTYVNFFPGNGPSAICLSYLLSGYRPYYNRTPVANPYLNDKLQKLKTNQSIVDMVSYNGTCEKPYIYKHLLDTAGLMQRIQHLSSLPSLFIKNELQ